MSSDVMKRLAVFLQGSNHLFFYPATIGWNALSLPLDEPKPEDRPTPADIADYTLKFSSLLEKLEGDIDISYSFERVNTPISGDRSPINKEVHWDSESSLYCDVENYDVNSKKVLKFSKHVSYYELDANLRCWLMI